jgi:hypothetical protein
VGEAEDGAVNHQRDVGYSKEEYLNLIETYSWHARPWRAGLPIYATPLVISVILRRVFDLEYFGLAIVLWPIVLSYYLLRATTRWWMERHLRRMLEKGARPSYLPESEAWLGVYGAYWLTIMLAVVGYDWLLYTWGWIGADLGAWLAGA